MGGFVVAPPSLIASKAIRGWIARALDHAGAMPAKAKKPSKAPVKRARKK
jgi:hypothetical protein